MGVYYFFLFHRVKVKIKSSKSHFWQQWMHRIQKTNLHSFAKTLECVRIIGIGTWSIRLVELRQRKIGAENFFTTCIIKSLRGKSSDFFFFEVLNKKWNIIVFSYDCVRMAHKVPKVVPLNNLHECIEEGYFPKMTTLTSARDIPSRQNRAYLYDLTRDPDDVSFKIRDLETFYDRIIEAIDRGYIIDVCIYTKSWNEHVVFIRTHIFLCRPKAITSVWVVKMASIFWGT